jgi:uncharacterized protein (TIGR02118 family)
MIKVSVLYPSRPGGNFDSKYYLDVHMPMAVKLLEPALKSASAEIGVSGAMPGQPPPFAAIASFTCESAQAFYQAFLPHAADLQGDIPNFTNIEPVIQISEIGISQ